MKKKHGDIVASISQSVVQFREVATSIFECSAVRCKLGEGLFFFPERDLVCWFDILDNKMFMLHDTTLTTIQLPFPASAGGCLPSGELLVATKAGLFAVDIDRVIFKKICDQAHIFRKQCRTNDGRMDRNGGFWFSTMQEVNTSPTGAIYRLFKNEVNIEQKRELLIFVTPKIITD